MSDHNPLTLKLNPWEKIAYGMGGAGSNLMFCIGTLYLPKFYTGELGMPTYYDGIIFLAAEFFAAFTDMLTRLLLDSRGNIGPKGKSRPFILYTATPAALTTTLQFIATTFCLPVKTTIVAALFMMFGLSYSLMNCSHGAMTSIVTKNPNGCVQLVTYHQGSVTIGLLICTVAFISLQSPFSDSTVDYAYAVLVFSIGGFIFVMLCYRDVEEHYVDTTPIGHRVNIPESLCAIFHSPPLLVLCIANLCILVAFNIKLAIQVYYTQYVLNDINLLSWMGFFSMGCILVGVLLVPVTVGCSGKKQVYLVGMALWVVDDISSYPWGSSPFTFTVFPCVALPDAVFVNSLNWALVPDTVDYGEWKTGIRAEGPVYTGYTPFHKISAALAGFLLGIMLTQVGHAPNITQGDATLQGLHQLIFVWPYALVIIAALTIGFFYTPDKKRSALIIEEINRRKDKEMATEEKTASATL